MSAPSAGNDAAHVPALGDIDVEIVDTWEELVGHAEPWRELHERDPESHYFLSWRWMSVVLAANPGAWRVLIARDRGPARRVVGILPLRRKTRFSESRDRFVTELAAGGKLSWAQYTGFICDPGREAAVIDALAACLLARPWARLELDKCAASERRLDRFLAPFQADGYGIRFGESIINGGAVNNLVCPYVELPGDYEGYLTERLSANTRQKVRRFTRRIERDPELSLSLVDHEHMGDGIEALLDMWMQRWAPRRGRATARDVAGKYREILWQSHEASSLVMPALRRGDRVIGALGCILGRKESRLYFIVSGRDERAPEPFIGLSLHAEAIRWAIANGVGTYDFCHGDEAYKYSFGAVDRRLARVRVRRRSGVAPGLLEAAGSETACEGSAPNWAAPVPDRASALPDFDRVPGGGALWTR